MTLAYKIATLWWHTESGMRQTRNVNHYPCLPSLWHQHWTLEGWVWGTWLKESWSVKAWVWFPVQVTSSVLCHLLFFFFLIREGIFLSVTVRSKVKQKFPWASHHVQLFNDRNTSSGALLTFWTMLLMFISSLSGLKTPEGSMGISRLPVWNNENMIVPSCCL